MRGSCNILRAFFFLIKIAEEYVKERLTKNGVGVGEFGSANVEESW